MKRLFHQWLSGCLLILAMTFQALSQTNLIVNGDFAAGETGWNLAFYGGQGAGAVANGVYTVTVSVPGSEPWHIQLTQNLITLDSGSAYKLSYEISATVERTIEAALARNGGDYFPYSGRDTIVAAQGFRYVERIFVMRRPTDRDVRMEFNCGKYAGNVMIRNVKLVRFTDPVLRITAPSAGELLYEGVPFPVSWSSINIRGGVTIDLSVDNGGSWKTIATLDNDTGLFVWTPAQPFSPWCRIRVSSTKDRSIFALNEGPFEIAPLWELVENGSFSSSPEKWSLGVYGGRATGGIIHDTIYRINVERSADEYWQIQLTQSGIPLKKGQTYRFSFIAYAENPTTIKINVGMSNEPFTSYFDTTRWIVALSTSPKSYVFVFTMKEQSDSNCRIEFNCGKSRGGIFIDQVSLTPEYVAPVRTAGGLRSAAAAVQTMLILTGVHRGHFMTHGNYQCRAPFKLIDLKGRTLIDMRTWNDAIKRGAVVRGGLTVPGAYLLKYKKGKALK